MYERSAIVLERYFNNIIEFDKKINLKTIYKNYKEMIEEIQNYQLILEKEDEVINEFEDVANEIRKIQQEQKRIYKSNIKFDEDRNQLFDSLDEDPSSIEKKLIKIEESIDTNNKRLEELREEFIKSLTNFGEKQKERNLCSRNRREEETKHLQIIDKADNDINQIDISFLKDLKEFIKSERETEKEEVAEIMMNNGKDEKIPFNQDVIENASKIRNDIAKKEAECYIIIYEKMRRLLSEVKNDDVKLDKYNKTLRDVSVKLAFLKAQKMYIVSFLDNERITAINGLRIHKQLMLDACEKFELDMEQFSNLYELILKEISGKSTKKAYKELYNKEYLKNIEEKEKNFEEEINNIKIKTGTIINSNYWRIEEIKNIYEIFQKEVSEKFEKDLSEYKLEEPQAIIENTTETNDNDDTDDYIFETEIDKENNEYIEEYEYEYDDEYDDESNEDEEYESNSNQYEYDDENDEENEYENYEEYEEDDEYDEYDEYDEEYEEDDEYDYYEEDEEDDDEDNYDEQDLDIEEEKEQDIQSKYKKQKGGIFNKFFKDKKD